MKKMWIGLAAIGFLNSCTQVGGWFGSNSDSTQNSLTSENPYRAKLVRDESITKENAYSDLFLDTAAVENYIRQKDIDGNDADRMREFYLVRNNQFAWFNSGGLTEQARGLWSLRASDVEDTSAGAISKTMDSLLTAKPGTTKNDSASIVTSETLLKDSAKFMDGSIGMVFDRSDPTVVQTELGLTHQLVRLAGAENGVVTLENFYWLVPRKKMDVMQLADSILTKDSSNRAANANYELFKKHLQLYYAAAKNGGWNSLVVSPGLKKGAKSAAVVALKKRLAATGDYPSADTSDRYNDSLIAAIKDVQERYGLQPTGFVTDSLVRELNVPAEERLQQILVNINRMAWLPQHDSSQIVVNIPSLQLSVYSDGSRVLDMPVIVGKEGTGTMALNDKITTIVFNPHWNIPQSIVENEIVPAMKQDPSYLKKQNMEIVKNGAVPEIRQLPGKNNALGRVKFLFPNSFDIYLHDTPNKHLFDLQNRALSHGCIRVAKPDSLAYYLLRHQPEWTPEKISAAMNSGKEQIVEVKKPLAVAIIYSTAFVDDKGRMNFRKDIYGYDKETADRMFVPTKLPPPSAG